MAMRVSRDLTVRRPAQSVGFAGLRRRSRVDLRYSTALSAAWIILLLLPVRTFAQPATLARPQGGVVVGGQATIAQTAQLTDVVQTSQRAAIDWRSYDVGSGHSVVYQQPNANAIVLNRVTGPDPSQIAGNISANGQVVLVNQSGVVFYKGAQVDAQSLVVSAAGVTTQNFMAGRMVFDQAPKPGATITNAGQLTVGQAGLAALVAPGVANTGTITAKMGHVVLAGAEAHTIDLYGDGLMSVDVTRAVSTAPSGTHALVTNTGTINADGGTVVLTAQAVDGLVQNLVNAGGRIQANSLPGHSGQIVIAGVGGDVTIEGRIAADGNKTGTAGGAIQVIASGTVNLSSTAQVTANGKAGGGTIAVGTTLARAQTQTGTAGIPAGTAQRVVMASGARISADGRGTGSGGTVALLSVSGTQAAGRITAKGGRKGGDGGQVEISGGTVNITGTVDTTAPKGKTGRLLIDPNVLTIGGDGPQDANQVGTVAANDTTPSNISTATFNGFQSSVNLAAATSITIVPNVTTTTTLFQSNPVTLTSGAGGIAINAPIKVTSTLNLVTTGSITESTAGSITAGTLSATAGTGITLTALTNAVTTLGAMSATTGDLYFAQAGSISVGGALSVSKTASDGAGNTISLIAAGGGISETAAGRIIAGTLTATGLQDIALTSAGAASNAVTTLGAMTASGNLTFAQYGPLTVAGKLSAGAGKTLAVSLTGADSTLTLDTTNAPILLSAPGKGIVELQADFIAFKNGAPPAPSAPPSPPVTETGGGMVAIIPGSSGRSLSVGTPADPTTINTTLVLSAAQILALMGNATTLNLGSTSAAPVSFAAASGSPGSPLVTITANAVSVAINETLSLGTAALGLFATGNITQAPAASITAGTLAAGSASGSITLTNSANAIANLATSAAPAGTLAISSSLPLTVPAGANISSLDTTLTAPSLTIFGEVGACLTAAPNSGEVSLIATGPGTTGTILIDQGAVVGAQTTATLSATGTVTVGHAGAVSADPISTLNAGHDTVGGTLNISGPLIVDGAGLVFADTINVNGSASGNGVLTIAGGTLHANTLNAGVISAPSGGELYSGSEPSGTLVIEGAIPSGTVVTPGNLTVTDAVGNTGATLIAGGTLSVQGAGVSYPSGGVVTQSGGTWTGWTAATVDAGPAGVFNQASGALLGTSGTLSILGGGSGTSGIAGTLAGSAIALNELAATLTSTPAMEGGTTNPFPGLSLLNTYHCTGCDTASPSSQIVYFPPLAPTIPVPFPSDPNTPFPFPGDPNRTITYLRLDMSSIDLTRSITATTVELHSIGNTIQEPGTVVTAGLLEGTAGYAATTSYPSAPTYDGLARTAGSVVLMNGNKVSQLGPYYAAGDFQLRNDLLTPLEVVAPVVAGAPVASGVYQVAHVLRLEAPAITVDYTGALVPLSIGEITRGAFSGAVAGPAAAVNIYSSQSDPVGLVALRADSLTLPTVTRRLFTGAISRQQVTAVSDPGGAVAVAPYTSGLGLVVEATKGATSNALSLTPTDIANFGDASAGPPDLLMLGNTYPTLSPPLSPGPNATASTLFTYAMADTTAGSVTLKTPLDLTTGGAGSTPLFTTLGLYATGDVGQTAAAGLKVSTVTGQAGGNFYLDATQAADAGTLTAAGLTADAATIAAASTVPNPYFNNTYVNGIGNASYVFAGQNVTIGAASSFTAAQIVAGAAPSPSSPSTGSFIAATAYAPLDPASFSSATPYTAASSTSHVTLTTAGALTLQGTIEGSTIRLQALNGITQAADGAILAYLLTGQSGNNGGVAASGTDSTLTGSGNMISQLGAFVSQGDLTISSNGTLTVQGDASGGVLAATDADARAFTSAMTNPVTARNVSLTAVAGLVINGEVGACDTTGVASGAITLTAPTITVGQTAGANTLVGAQGSVLFSGNLVQTGGLINSPVLSLADTLTQSGGRLIGMNSLSSAPVGQDPDAANPIPTSQTGGVIWTNGNLYLTGDNFGGTVAAGGVSSNIRIAGTNVGLGGVIEANGSIAVTGSQTITTGTVGAGGDITLSAGTTVTLGGLVSAGGNLLVNGLNGATSLTGTIVQTAHAQAFAGGNATLLAQGDATQDATAVLAANTVTVVGADGANTFAASSVASGAGVTVLRVGSVLCPGCSPPGTDPGLPGSVVGGQMGSVRPTTIRLDGDSVVPVSAIAANTVILNSTGNTIVTPTVTANLLTGSAGYARTGFDTSGLPVYQTPVTADRTTLPPDAALTGGVGTATLVNPLNNIWQLGSYSVRGNDTTRAGFALISAPQPFADSPNLAVPAGLTVTGPVRSGLPNDALDASAAQARGNDVTITVTGAQGALIIPDASQIIGRNVTLSAQGKLSEAGTGQIVAGTLSATSVSGDVTLTTSTDGLAKELGNQVGTISGGAAGNFDFNNSRSLIATSIEARGSVLVTAQYGVNTTSVAEGQAAGNLTVTGDVKSDMGNVTLTAYGDLTQTAGLIGVPAGAARTGTVSLMAGGTVSQTAGAISTATLTGAAGVDFNLPNGTLNAVDVMGQVTAVAGNITFSDSVPLGVSGPVVAQGGVVIAAPSLTLSGNIYALQDIDLLTTGSLSQVSGTVAAHGDLYAGADPNTAGGASAITQAASGTLAAGGKVTLVSTGDAVQDAQGTLAGSTIQVIAGGNNSFGAAQGVSAVTDSASVTLVPLPVVLPVFTTPQGAVTLAGRPSSLRLDGATLTIPVALAADAIELHSTGATTQSAAITTPSLTGTAGYAPTPSAGPLPTYAAAGAPASATLNLATNAIATVGSYNATGDLSLRTSGSLTLSGLLASSQLPVPQNLSVADLAATTGTGTITVQAGGKLDLGTSQLAGAVVNLLANTGIDGGKAQIAAGTLTANGTVTAPAAAPAADVTLTGPSNLIATAGNLTATGALSLADSQALIVAGPLNGASVSITAPAITLAGDVTANSPVAAQQLVTLTSSAGDLNQTGGVIRASLGTVSLTSTGAMNQSDPGSITAQTLTLSAGGNASLIGSNNQIASIGTSSSTTGGLAVKNAAALTVSGQVNAPGQQVTLTTTSGNLILSAGITAGTATLNAAGDLTQQGGTLSLTSLTASAGGAISLTQANTIGSVEALNAGTTLSLTDAQSLQVDGPVAANQKATLTTAQDLTLAGPVTAPVVNLVAAGQVAQIQGIVATSALTVSGTSISLISDNAIGSLAGATSSAGDLTLQTANALTVSGAVQVAGNTSLTSDQTLTTTPGSSITGTGGASIVALKSAGDMTLAGTMAAPQITIDAVNQTVSFNGGSISVGGSLQPVGVRLAQLPARGQPGIYVAAGQVAQTGTTRVLPLPGSAAATIRLSLTGTGLTFNDFETPSGNLIADLNQGVATGNFGVLNFFVDYIPGGKVALNGTVGAFAGAAAASKSKISVNQNTNYRVDGCPIAGINCVLLAPQLVPISNPLKDLTLSFFRPQDETDMDFITPNISDKGL